MTDAGFLNDMQKQKRDKLGMALKYGAAILALVFLLVYLTNEIEFKYGKFVSNDYICGHAKELGEMKSSDKEFGEQEMMCHIYCSKAIGTQYKYRNVSRTLANKQGCEDSWDGNTTYFNEGLCYCQGNVLIDYRSEEVKLAEEILQQDLPSHLINISTD